MDIFFIGAAYVADDVRSKRAVRVEALRSGRNFNIFVQAQAREMLYRGVVVQKRHHFDKVLIISGIRVLVALAHRGDVEIFEVARNII